MTSEALVQLLVVEDVEEMRSLLEQVLGGIGGLKLAGMAGNGSEARLQLRRNRPELVLLDEVLPGESSLDLLNEFMQEGIPVILMTSMDNPSHALPKGARLRIAKPGWESLDEDRGRVQRAIFSVVKRKG